VKKKKNIWFASLSQEGENAREKKMQKKKKRGRGGEGKKGEWVL
jgi:hypothetical protein